MPATTLEPATADTGTDAVEAARLTPKERYEQERERHTAERAERRARAVESGCDACIHAAEHGWWGKLADNARTHCGTCHRSWASLREMHCVTCHRHFSSPAACDAHLAPTGCKDPETLTLSDGRPKFTTVDHGRGPVWRLAFYGETPGFFGSAAADDELDAA